MKYYLDDDSSEDVAVIARNLGVDTVSCHGLGREGLPDDEQLLFAGIEGRAIVTINRDDFIARTIEFHERGLPHAGVVIVSRPVQRREFAAVAHALLTHAHEYPDGMQPYSYDFLTF